jgi:hypothetical protein
MLICCAVYAVSVLRDVCVVYVVYVVYVGCVVCLWCPLCVLCELHVLYLFVWWACRVHMRYIRRVDATGIPRETTQSVYTAVRDIWEAEIPRSSMR